MPVPGPRTQQRPLPGYTNPDRETPDRFNQWLRPSAIAELGRTPGLMYLTRRGCVLAAGQIRQLWRQSINFTGAQASYSWTRNSPAPDRPVITPTGFRITTALRYMARSVYMGAGNDNTRFAALHTQVNPKVRHKPVTIGAGTVKNRPTVRNRLTSFGSRVPTLNSVVPAAQKDNQ